MNMQLVPTSKGVIALCSADNVGFAKLSPNLPRVGGEVIQRE
jgi:hypothetical protein